MAMFVVIQDEHGHIDVQHVDENMERLSIKSDAFHAIQAYKKTIKKHHGMFHTFSGMLRDAMFMADPDKMKQEERKLSDSLFQNPNSRCHENHKKANKEAKRHLYCPGSKLLEDKEHIIPPPSGLAVLL